MTALICGSVFGCNSSHRTVAKEVGAPDSKGSAVSDTAPRASVVDRCVVPSPGTPPEAAGPAASCPADPVFGGVSLEKAKVSFPDAPGAPSITAELAVTDEERARGLMYRTHMAENDGMLFVMDGPPRVQSFWMRNTCMPLDMMFIAEDGFITGILENVPTLNDDRRSIPCPASHVLEVNAGWSRAHGVKAGQMVSLPKK